MCGPPMRQPGFFATLLQFADDAARIAVTAPVRQTQMGRGAALSSPKLFESLRFQALWI